MEISWKKILLLPMCGFGDAVCYLPFVVALRAQCPDARIVCLVISEPAKAVLETSHANIEVIVFNRSGQQSGWRALAGLIGRLRRIHFDVVVSGAHPDSPRIPLMALLSGARVRIGAQAERLSFLYNRRLDIRTNSHAYERFRLLLAGLGVTVPAEQYLPALQPSTGARAEAMRLWSEAGLDTSPLVVGLVSGADTNARGRWKPYLKRWRPERYAEIVQWITEEAGGRAVMFGGPDERALADQIAVQSGLPLVNFCGQTSVGVLPWLLQMCEALVTNDTGVMHVAAAVGTPVVALFGPTSSLDFGPIGPQHVMVEGRIHCSPCYPHPTCDLKGCGAMDDISAEQVKTSLAKVLGRLVRPVTSNGLVKNIHPRS